MILLHDMNIAHTDIKPKNIFYKGEKIATDIGSAIDLTTSTPDEKYFIKAFTKEFASPRLSNLVVDKYHENPFTKEELFYEDKYQFKKTLYVMYRKYNRNRKGRPPPEITVKVLGLAERDDFSMHKIYQEIQSDPDYVILFMS